MIRFVFLGISIYHDCTTFLIKQLNISEVLQLQPTEVNDFKNFTLKIINIFLTVFNGVTYIDVSFIVSKKKGFEAH